MYDLALFILFKLDTIKFAMNTMNAMNAMNALKVPRIMLFMFWQPPKRKQIFPDVDSKSETIAMSKQDWYGHLNGKQEIEHWLTENYKSSSQINLSRRLLFVGDLLKADGLTRNILELGGGASDMSAFLSTQFKGNHTQVPIFTVSDISMALIEKFFPKVCKFFNVDIARFPRVVSFGESIPFESNTFDAIIAKSAVHHFESFVDAGHEIHRVLKINGSLVFLNDPIIKPRFPGRGRGDASGSSQELALGFNCRAYSFREYIRLGTNFRKILVYVDPGLTDYFHFQLIPHWGPKSFRALVSGYLLKFAIGRTFLSIFIGLPLIFKFVK